MQTIDHIFRKYPQLLLPIQEGISKTEEYKDAVLRGKIVNREPEFSFSEKDQCFTCNTPAGDVEVLLMSGRPVFEWVYQALAYRCEPTPVLPSVGAGFLSGLINWEKIHRHEEEYLASGKTDWPDEFKRFTADKKNYTDTLILLSSGPYSNIPAEWVSMQEEEWIQRSVRIRLYHELTHFICRKFWPEKKDALRDEIYADCIGLVAAFGDYDTYLAKLFLGIDKEQYRKGGRLEHYTPECTEENIRTAKQWIEEAESRTAAAWRNGQLESLSETERDEAIFDLIGKIY